MSSTGIVISVNMPAGDLMYVHVSSSASRLIAALSLMIFVVCNTSSVPGNEAEEIMTVSRLVPSDFVVVVLCLK